jgi:hypothetical protein
MDLHVYIYCIYVYVHAYGFGVQVLEFKQAFGIEFCLRSLSLRSSQEPRRQLQQPSASAGWGVYNEDIVFPTLNTNHIESARKLIAATLVGRFVAIHVQSGRWSMIRFWVLLACVALLPSPPLSFQP